mgnify:CR=1 FL=1
MPMRTRNAGVPRGATPTSGSLNDRRSEHLSFSFSFGLRVGLAEGPTNGPIDHFVRAKDGIVMLTSPCGSEYLAYRLVVCAIG